MDPMQRCCLVIRDIISCLMMRDRESDDGDDDNKMTDTWQTMMANDDSMEDGR